MTKTKPALGDPVELAVCPRCEHEDHEGERCQTFPPSEDACSCSYGYPGERGAA